MDKMNKFYLITNSLISGIILIVLGIILLMVNVEFYEFIISLFLFSILLTGVAYLISYRFLKDNELKKKLSFSKSLVNILFVLILLIFPKIPLSILPLIFGIYLLLNSIIRFIVFYSLFKNNGNGKLKELSFSLGYFIIGIPMLFTPISSIENVLDIIGIYLILLGLTWLKDMLSKSINDKYKTKIRRKIRVSLPVVIETFIPYFILRDINSFINNNTNDLEKDKFISKKSDEDVDLEIFVHTSLNGFNKVGHIDICFEGEIISYGNYDYDSMKFFNMFGDGVLFTTKNKEKYIKFCISHSKKTIFGFGLKLNDLQKKKIREQINKIYEELHEWKPLCLLNENNYDECNDYSSLLYKDTKAKFYKFNSGKFKTYFVVGVNCCLLADKIIGKSGTDLIKLYGVITPGAYYEYLNNEFLKKNSMVISRNIYNSVTTKESKKFRFNIFDK